MKNGIFAWTSALFLMISFSSCGNVEPPEFKNLGGFKVKRFGLQQADVAFKVTYYNPNKFGVSVKEASVDLYLDTIYLGRFSQPTLVSVDKKADFSIPLEGAISTAKALQLNMNDLLNREVTVKATGSVKVGKGGVFVNRDINYQGKHRVDVKL